MSHFRLGVLGASDERIAVIEPGRGSVSYYELNDLADRVASRLGDLRIGAGARVGIALTRSTDAVAVMLGCLRAGAGYVPLDPGAPVARNAEILADSGVALSFVERDVEGSYRDALAALGSVIELHPLGHLAPGRAVDEWLDGSHERRRGTEGNAPNDLACVLYTSGSTGRHKGWMMTRGAVEAHVAWCHEFLAPGSSDVFANHAQFNFGMSLFDIHSSLGSGARLVLVPEASRANASRVVEILGRERVTIWFSAPAILSRMAAVENLESQDLRALRVVAFAGEVFPLASLNALRSRLPHPRYFNFYGTTETNVAAYYELPAGIELVESPPIGRPCSHYQARVVDAAGQPVPRGTPGDLELRGRHLFGGYLNQPDLTEERSTEAVDGGPPWYSTRDRVIELATGNFRYLGRSDRMLKVRGYRVEPGEVEARLYEHPRIREAAVVPADTPSGVGLVAHLSGARLSVVELKEFCSEKLPAYMVPERFVFHETLPRLPRGKIDFETLRSG
ncbi:MAG TPA: amino acid adenylation domain-containing protein [Polyangiaceae bacterium]